MKKYVLFLLFFSMSLNVISGNRRVIVTTDIGGTDPDDEQSMVHLLLCANDIDIEGLICQMAFCPSTIGIEPLHRILSAYKEAYPNLVVHDQKYPTYDYLCSIATTGQTEVGMKGVGDGYDTPGSNLIIKAVDSDDPRPIWLTAWGGMNTIAQAIWKVQSTRDKTELKKFLSKIRIYDILGQCDAGAWIAHNFPEVTYIRARDVYGWAPDDKWIENNIQKFTPFGDIYPNRKWATEGDSPSFMYLINNGLNNPEDVASGGWGGRFNREKTEGVRGMDWVKRNNLDESKHDSYWMYTNPTGEATIRPWKEHIKNDFATRVKWSCTNKYENANHHPIILIDDEKFPTRDVLNMNVKAGQRIIFNVKDSYDPDGNNLSFRGYLYKEASNYYDDISLVEKDGLITFKVPDNAIGHNLHIIIEASDSGIPMLTTYRRVIVNVE